MLRMLLCLFLFLSITVNVFSQMVKLDHQYVTAKTVELKYPMNYIDVRALGMGGAHTANGKHFNAMMYNPAMLGHKRSSIEFFGIHTGMPFETYDAADYLVEHIDEFYEAASLNQVWDGLDQLTAAGATNPEKLDALHEIQDGLVFVDDLLVEVTGPADNPKTHGVNLQTGFSAQFGSWGFSLYGLGQAGFIMQLSPAFESLTEIDVPSTLSDRVAVARAIVQLTAALVPAITDNRKFSDSVYPTAFYASYFDVVGTAGYAMPVYENLTVGANLKIINRRFLLDRIPVDDYDEIINNAWSKFKSSRTGLTADLGAHYQFGFGTSAGLALHNVIPVKEIKKTIDTDFKFSRIVRSDITQDGRIDSLRYLTWEATVTRPFALKLPFVVNLGLCHPLTDNWDIALDWVDILENDFRYEKTYDRLRLGTEYRYELFRDKLTITPRIGLADQRAAMGLGFNIYQLFQLDCAYAYDRFVNQYAFYAQLKIGW